MVKQINEYTVDELSAKIEAIKAEREKTANALKKYEEELERRKQEVPLGVPSKGNFCVSGYGGIINLNGNYSVQAQLCDSLNIFYSRESAKKHAEMLLAWRKALVDISKGEPIDIQVLLPLLKKGWVVMTDTKHWLWFENKPYISIMDLWSSCVEKDGHKEYIRGELIRPFNIKPADNWETSLMECGL